MTELPPQDKDALRKTVAQKFELGTNTSKWEGGRLLGVVIVLGQSLRGLQEDPEDVKVAYIGFHKFWTVLESWIKSEMQTGLIEGSAQWEAGRAVAPLRTRVNEVLKHGPTTLEVIKEALDKLQKSLTDTPLQG